MSYRILTAEEAARRPSNQMSVMNTDLAKHLEARTLGARLWRLAPGQASTRHRHRVTTELYVPLEGTGRIRVGDDLHTVAPLSSVLVDAGEVRQLFNDTDADQLWLVVGAPPEPANTLEMTDEELGFLYPAGPRRSHPSYRRPSHNSPRDRTPAAYACGPSGTEPVGGYDPSASCDSSPTSGGLKTQTISRSSEACTL